MLTRIASGPVSRLMARERYQSSTTKLGEALRLWGGLDRFNALSGDRLPAAARRVSSGNAFAP